MSKCRHDSFAQVTFLHGNEEWAFIEYRSGRPSHLTYFREINSSNGCDFDEIVRMVAQTEAAPAAPQIQPQLRLQMQPLPQLQRPVPKIAAPNFPPPFLPFLNPYMYNTLVQPKQENHTPYGPGCPSTTTFTEGQVQMLGVVQSGRTTSSNVDVSWLNDMWSQCLQGRV